MKFEDIRDYLNGRKDLAEWTFEESRERSREAFHTGRRLDLARAKEVTKGSLTIHADGIRPDGSAGRGSAVVAIPATAEKAELAALADKALARARVSLGAPWTLPRPAGAADSRKAAGSAAAAGVAGDLADAVEALAEAARAAEDEGRAAAASGSTVRTAALELFATARERRLASSAGADFAWADVLLETEIAASGSYPGAAEAELVEGWSASAAAEGDLEAAVAEFRAAARDLIARTGDRARARPFAAADAAGGLRIELAGDAVPEFFGHFFFRASAAQARFGVTDVKIGGRIVPYELGGDPLSFGFDPRLPLCPENRPADADCLPLERTALAERGTALALEGAARHAAALGVRAVGTCLSRWVAPGSLSRADLDALPRLEALIFSDFFMDYASGDFGGELRLGILHAGGKTIPVTGGSISGSVSAEAAGLRFSRDLGRRGSFRGPASVLLSAARAAGI